MGEIYSFLDYFKYLDNPFECLLFKLGLKKEVTVETKKFNQKVAIKKSSSLNRLMNALVCNVRDFPALVKFIQDVESNKKIINWGDLKIYNAFDLPIGSFYELFNEDYWDIFGIDFNNRTIIDIGSNAGDSSLFFASKGAEVYAFEPVLELHELALKNASLNPNLEDRLHFFNIAVSKNSGVVNIDSLNSTSVYTSSKGQKHSYDVEALTVYDILQRYSIKEDILKIDCEGCEFRIVLNSNLSRFNDIILEHHSKMINRKAQCLINKLEKDGFKIKKYPSFGFDFKDMGLIHAYKEK